MKTNFVYAWIGIIVISGVCLFQLTGEAVTTFLWKVDTAEEFLAGNPESTSISTDGWVILAPELEMLADTVESIAWSIYLTGKDDLWVGTGTQGKLFHIDGKGAIKEYADLEDTEIHCITADSQGTLYLGTMPNGNIYRMLPGQKPELYIETGEKYIWDMVTDNKDNLYVATGEQGKIFKITAKGEKKSFYNSGETHIMCMTISDQTLYAGTYPGGQVLRFTLDGKAFMMFDSELEEIQDIMTDVAGNLYVAANPENNSSKNSSSEPGFSMGMLSSSMSGFSMSSGGSPESVDFSFPTKDGKSSAKTTRSTIYKIYPSGTVTEFWECPEAYIMCLHVNDKNQVLVGTADDGKIYLLDPLGNSTSWIKTREKQVLSIIQGKKDKYYIACGNNGIISEVTAGYRMEGIYTSYPFDTKSVSQWGRISWDIILPDADKTAVYLKTRTGNSAVPDETWSDWSNQHDDSTGETISSPPARYIQWQAKLLTFARTETPVLKKVTVAFLQENLPPKIARASVFSPWEKKTSESGKEQPDSEKFASWLSSELGKSFSAIDKNSGSKKRVPPSIRTIAWESSDPNDDVLTADLYFKGEDESTWKLLEEDIRKQSVDWDTFLVPDGLYRIKIVCSDRLSNPHASTLETEKITDPFIVDNTAPEVARIKAQQQDTGECIVTGMVKDDFSLISRIEMSIDAGDWKLVFPDDNILDSSIESFSAVTEKIMPGEHTIIIRVIDSAGNVGAGKKIIRTR